MARMHHDRRGRVGRVLRVIGGAVVCLVLAATAHAQLASGDEATREGEAAAARRAKAEALEANVPSRAEAAILYVEETRLAGRIFNPPAGWFAQVGGLTEGSGLALGGGYRLPVWDGATLDARGMASWSRAFLADLTWRYEPLRSGRVRLTANVARERHANQLFFGLGPDTSDHADSEFDLDERRVQAGIDVGMAWWLRAGMGVGFRRMSLHDLDLDFDTDDEAAESSTVGLATDAGVPGIGTAPAFASTYVHGAVDTRRSGPGGLRLGVRYARHRDTGVGAHDFSALRVDVEQFIPMWKDTRVIALRAIADRVWAGAGQSVPFYLQPTLGGSRTLRAYERQRFRDASTLLLQAEYRYIVNPFLAGAIFADAGQVAPDWTTWRMRSFRGDVGVGLRIGYGSLVAVRTDLAFGGEGPRLVIALSGVF